MKERKLQANAKHRDEAGKGVPIIKQRTADTSSVTLGSKASYVIKGTLFSTADGRVGLVSQARQYEAFKIQVSEANFRQEHINSAINTAKSCHNRLHRRYSILLHEYDRHLNSVYPGANYQAYCAAVLSSASPGIHQFTRWLIALRGGGRENRLLSTPFPCRFAGTRGFCSSCLQHLSFSLARLLS